jgi:hypothetical protein
VDSGHLICTATKLNPRKPLPHANWEAVPHIADADSKEPTVESFSPLH